MANVSGTAASEVLQGGAGNDHIEDREGGSDTLYGDAGDDRLIVARLSNLSGSHIRMEGGEGTDELWLQSLNLNGTTAVLDGGGGNDLFYLWATGNGATVTTGSGSDTIRLDDLNLNYNNNLVVTDFTTGAGGDRLDWDGLLGGWLTNWDGGNPFGSGHVRLLQSGADTLLQIDRDGGGDDYTTLLTFQNTTASALNAENLGGFASDGSTLPDGTITGTADSETLNGTGGNDIINGLGGHDTINGGAGDDQIEGGAGDDNLFGNLGSDTVRGGADNDRIEDRDGGSDTLYGDGGDDTLVVGRSSNMSGSQIRMEGGQGDDVLWLQTLNLNGTTTVLDGGDGLDLFYLWATGNGVTITTGAGTDTIWLANLNLNYNNNLVVTDFTTGGGGDRLSWDGLLGSWLTNWDGGNPFTSGHVRLLQSGADTLVQIDRDGGANGNNYGTLLTLQNATASALNSYNLIYTPVSSPVTASLNASAYLQEGQSTPLSITFANVSQLSTTIVVSVVGTSSATGEDVSIPVGTFAINVSQAPVGDYTYQLGEMLSLDDLLVEGLENVVLEIRASGQSFGPSGDSIQVSVNIVDNDLVGTSGLDTLIGDAGRNRLDGGLGDDLLTGLAGDDLLVGGEGDDRLLGGVGADQLNGGNGDDLLRGGTGADQLDGGVGNDTASYELDYGGVNVNLAVGIGIWNAAQGDTLTGIEHLTGTAFGDVLTGDAGDNRLAGRGGADQLNGGAGADTADYSVDFDPVNVSLATGLGLWNSAQGDVLTGIEHLTGTASGDVLTGDSGDNRLAGGGGEDQLNGGSGNDELFGGDGWDRLIGGPGADLLNGGASTDTADYSADHGAVNVNLATGRGQGNSAQDDVLTSIENLVGTAFNDVLTGDAGTNSLSGGGGDDRLAGGVGSDEFIGGAGNDTVDYSTDYGAVYVNLATRFGRWNAADGDMLFEIEHVIGTAFGDVLTGDENDNQLAGGAGADQLIGGAGLDTADYSADFGGVNVNLANGVGLWNAAHGDTLIGIENLVGTAYGDVLTGDAADNRLAGGLGADQLNGGAGRDTADYSADFGAVNVNLINAVGLWNAAHGDVLTGIENLTGTAWGDVLTGNAADNRLDGGDGDDWLSGGVGADQLHGGAGFDTADYSAEYGAVNVNLATGAGVWNAAHGDTLTGIEHLVGTAFGDLLTGDAANNRLNGGQGDDQLSGGAGNDVFVIGAGFGRDRITDFKSAGGADVAAFAAGLFTGFDDLMAHAVQVGADVVITLGDNTLTLTGVQRSSLQSGDFAFGVASMPGQPANATAKLQAAYDDAWVMPGLADDPVIGTNALVWPGEHVPATTPHDLLAEWATHDPWG